MTVDELLQPFLKTTKPLQLEDNQQTIPAWDSLAQLHIIFAIEEKIGGELSTEEVMALNSISNIVKVCRKRGLDLQVECS